MAGQRRRAKSDNIFGCKKGEEERTKTASFRNLNPNPIVEVDSNDKISYANPAAKEFFPDLNKLGSRHPFLGDWQKVVETLKEKPSSTLNQEIQIGGKWYYQQLYFVPQSQRIRIYSIDITKRKKVEEALRESEDRLKRSQEIAHLGSWELDLVNDKLTWSDEVYRIFGLRPQEFGATYEAFLSYVHPDDRAAVDHAYSGSVLEGKDSYEIEHRVIRKDTGEVRFVHEKCTNLKDDSGKIIRSLGMVHDITERKLAEDKLKESEIRFSTAFRFNPTAMAITHIDGTFIDANESMQKLTGYSIDEIIGKNASTLGLFAEIIDREKILSLLAKGSDFSGYETTFKHKSGKPVRTLFSLAVIYLNGKPHMLGSAIDITERKKAEEKLRVSEERFLKAFNASPMSIAISRQSDGLFIEVNGAYEKIFGFTRKEIIGKTATQLNILVNSNQRNEIIKILKEKGRILNVEVPFKSKKGSIINTLSSLDTIKVDDENYVISTILDITERKKAEEALKKSREAEFERRKELEALMETAPATIWFAHDPQCLSMTGNKATYDLLRLPYGVNVSETAPEKERPNFMAYLDDKPVDTKNLPLQKAARTGKSVVGSELELRFADGRRVWLYGNAEPLFSEDGQVKGAIGAFTDISEVKKSEAALKESEELFSKAFHSISFPVSLGRLSDNQFVDVNESFLQMIGYSRNEVIGHTSKELKIFPKYKGREEFVPKLEENGSIHDQEIDIQNKQGKIIKGLFSVELIIINGQQHMLSSVIDVTAQRRLEKEVQSYTKGLESLVEQRTKELKDAERLAAIGATAGMVGHDIRNPLHAMSGDVFLAKSDIADLPDSEGKKSLKESLDSIEENIFYINKIVADLQDYGGPLSPRLEKIDFTLLIEMSLTIMRIPSNIIASYRVDSDARFTAADSDYVKRILCNLILNAIQAMPAGGKLSIRVSKNASALETILEVSDNGIGIADSLKPKIFTPMFTTKSKGQGFGLAVVKRLTEAMGGDVSFSSQVGNGTTFIVRLPFRLTYDKNPQKVNSK